MRDIAFLAMFLAMLPVALRYGHVATMLWAWVAMVAPVQYMFGLAGSVPFNKIVVAAGFIALVVDHKRRPAFYADSHVVLLLGFLAVGMVSFMVGLPFISRSADLADRLFKTVVLCLFVVATIRTRLHIHSLLIAVSMGMGIHGAIEAAKYVVSGGGHVLIGPGTIGDNNHFGLAILMVIAPIAYLYFYSQALIVRVAFALAALANVVAVIATHSRGALLGLIAVGIAVFIKSRNKVATLLVLAALGGVGLSLAPERWFDRMESIGDAKQDSSFMGRVSSWKMNLLVALDRPLTGGGFSSMEDPAVWSRYLPRFSSLDFLPGAYPTIPLAAHSIYFQVLGDTGFIGLGLFLGLLFVAFRNIAIIQRLAKDRPDLEWAVDLGRYLRLSLIGFVVAGAALSLAYFEFYYVVITLLSVTRRHVEEAVRKEVPRGVARAPVVSAPPVGGLLAGEPAYLRRGRQ